MIQFEVEKHEKFIFMAKKYCFRFAFLRRKSIFQHVEPTGGKSSLRFLRDHVLILRFLWCIDFEVIFRLIVKNGIEKKN